MSPGAVEIPLAIPREHPAFEGHFPGHPILPGVVLLAEALAAIEAATGHAQQEWTISNVKFLRPVEPGTALTLAHERLASGAMRFEIRSALGAVANGTCALRESP
jgi:3-hydroxymyristoyl/3-hydroxydecanoyl-(acyl carrier protein) dehydratase